MKATERSVSLSDADYAAIVKRYEDAGDVQNADIIRRQWEVARAGNTPRDKLLTIIAAAYQVAGAHNVPAHILDVLANPEVATNAQVDAMLPYVPTSPGQASASQIDTRRDDPLITVGFNDLMTLARSLIAEQIHDCDEEFMAGRAHGVGSFHSEILELSKRTALAQARNENETILALHRQLAGERLRADQGWERAEAKSRECIQLRERMAFSCQAQDVPQSAGAPETCRSSEKVQVMQVDELLGRYWEIAYSEGKTGKSRGSEAQAVLSNIRAAFSGSQDAHLPAESGASLALLPTQSDGTDAERSTQSEASEAPNNGQGINDLVALIVHRDTPPDLGGDEVVGWDMVGTPITRRTVRAFQVKGSNDPLPPCDPHPPSPLSPRAATELAEEVLATVLWLYRRLPRGYGRPPTVERPILALAKQTGIDVTDCLAERGPDPALTRRAQEGQPNGE